MCSALWKKVHSLLARNKLKLSSLKFGNDSCVQDFEKKDSRIAARKQLKLSSLKFENETCAHFERKMASSPARKQLNVHCSMIRAHLSNLKFRNDICVHHFKSEVASLLANKHLKLKLGITCQIFATFETTNASETSSAYKLFCIEVVPQTVSPDLESGNGELFLRPQVLK